MLAEQIAYFHAIAMEFEDHAIPSPGESDVIEVLEDFHPTGRVFELAFGPAVWTERLLLYVTSITSVDAAPEMLASAKTRGGEECMQFIRQTSNTLSKGTIISLFLKLLNS